MIGSEALTFNMNTCLVESCVAANLCCSGSVGGVSLKSAVDLFICVGACGDLAKTDGIWYFAHNVCDGIMFISLC